MTFHRTFTFFAALTLGSLTAQAGPAQTYGEHYPMAPNATSTLTRAEVVADLVAARQAGTLPRNGNWSNVPAPLAMADSMRTREEVRAEAVEAARSGSSNFSGE